MFTGNIQRSNCIIRWDGSTLRFKLVETELNTYSNYETDMDPSEIQLESTAKMFEYEKLSREIENCDNIDELKQMTRAFVKLYLKHQEVAAHMKNEMNLIERDDPRYFTETSSEPYDRHHYKVIRSTGEHVVVESL